MQKYTYKYTNIQKYTYEYTNIHKYPLAFGLPATVPQPGFAVVLWQKQISTAFLALFKSRGECCPNFDIHFCGLGIPWPTPRV